MAAALVGTLLFFFIVIRKLTRVLYRAFLMDKIHTEASQRERVDQSGTTTSTMMNLEEVGREFERSVIDEGQGILVDKIHMEASQREREDESATTTSKMMNLKEVGREFKRSVRDEGQGILKRLDDLLGQTIYLGLKDPPKRPLRRLTAPFVGKESDIVGRDGDKEQIIELLLSDDAGGNNLSVIPIVGMGGIGKTTLAQLVYKDSRVQRHFDLKVWVTISEDFDVSRITKIILEKVTSKTHFGDLFDLQSELSEALAGKKFLFVHDDVWNEKYELWDGLKSAFESGARGSKVIVTTRSKEVALTMSMGVMHELKLVSDQDCWRIFEKHVFEDSTKAPAQLQEIGREIVKRCKGLPLAVKSLAGLLRSANSKPEEWRKILNSDIWRLQFQKDLTKKVVPAVWLSYQFLPPYLKRCFAYLSVFPKDYLFDMKKIIWLWMAEGLLQPEKGKEAEEVGEEYLQALIGRSFFQYSSQCESVLIMHDIVHDLAMFFSGEFCFEFNNSYDLSNLPTKACHLFISTEDSYVLRMIMKGLTSQTRSLRTFLVSAPELVEWDYDPFRGECLGERLLHQFFRKVGGCLRVLSLSQSYINKLPDSIGNMKYLRCLDLSNNGIEELPDSFCTLYSLQTLLLSGCRNLVRLPTRLSALVNLRHLDISDTDSLEEMPPQMCNLKNLQTLSDFILGKSGGWRIKELGELALLGGTLRISGLEYIVDVKDVLEANLKDKKFLSELILNREWWVDSNITSSQQEREREREVLEALQPHTNLKQLRIEGYRGTIFPNWVGHESFCNMVEVDLLSCRNVCMLPPLGQLSSLRRIHIGGLDGVVSIGNEFCGSSSTTTNHPFTSLEELSIAGMKSWKEWSFSSDRLGQEGGVFPSLTKLHLKYCSKLIVGLPDCHLPFLQSIKIMDCDEMEGVFVCQSRQETDTNAFPSLQSIEIRKCKKLIVGLPDCHLPSLKSIDIHNCDEMVGVFVCQSPLPSLKSITISSCSEMEGVFVCQSRQEMDTNAFPSLQSMFVSACPKLESLLGRQSFPSMESLEFRIYKKLWENRRNWGLERLSSPMKITLSLWGIEEEVDSFPEEGLLLPTTLTELTIASFKKLKGLNGRAFQHLTSLRNLDIWDCGELECLPQEGLPLSLSYLTIDRCSKLLKQRCQRGTGEDWPKIQHIPNYIYGNTSPIYIYGTSEHSTSIRSPYPQNSPIFSVTNIFEQELQDHQRPSLLRNKFGWLAIKEIAQRNVSSTSQIWTIIHYCRF